MCSAALSFSQLVYSSSLSDSQYIEDWLHSQHVEKEHADECSLSESCANEGEHTKRKKCNECKLSLIT